MHLSVFRGGKRALWGEISRLSRTAPIGVVSAHRGLDGKGRSALPKHPTTPLASGQVNGSDPLTDVSDHGGASTRPIHRERRQAAALSNRCRGRLVAPRPMAPNGERPWSTLTGRVNTYE
jgi:hypothetical protein